MANTNAVKDPKNGVISCWVCTFAVILMDVVRMVLLRGLDAPIFNWIFGVLIVIWVIISVVETIKYVKGKSEKKAK